jgi:hypothetical protein
MATLEKTLRNMHSAVAAGNGAASSRILAAAPARSEAAVVAFAVVSLVWIGVLLGVSFLATPVKFLAPSLTIPVALDVGRQTFHWLNRVEIAFALVTLLTAVAYDLPALRRGIARGNAPRSRSSHDELPYATLLGSILLVAVAAQGLWLLPVLDMRVETVIQGGMPPPSWLHDAYVVIEACKLGALVGGAWLAIVALRTRNAGPDAALRAPGDGAAE